MMKNKKRNYAFTMLELVFVIVIMGIIGKFGVEFLAQAYKGFIFSKINNELQANSAYAVEVISKRLEHRIKQSAIYRNLTLAAPNFRSLDSGSDANATVLEWIGTDIEGYRNVTWSGVIDLNASIAADRIISLNTNTTNINALIQTLSDSNSVVNDAAIYFVGSFLANNEWGWDGNATKFNTQANVDIHPINSNGVTNQFVSPTGTFSGVSAKEYYKLAWTAYAVALEADPSGTMDNLYLYSNYQPWKGEQYDDAGIGIDRQLLMQNVSSFQFRAAGSLMKIQVCTQSDLSSNEEYSLCKEKTIY